MPYAMRNRSDLVAGNEVNSTEGTRQLNYERIDFTESERDSKRIIQQSAAC